VGSHAQSVTVPALDVAQSQAKWRRASALRPARSQLLRDAADAQFAVPAYCFMPDHLHILAIGESPNSDLERFMSTTKQQTGFWFAKYIAAGSGKTGTTIESCEMMNAQSSQLATSSRIRCAPRS